MTFTLNTHLQSFTELVFCIYQFSGLLTAKVSEISTVSLFPIEKSNYKILTCRKIGQGHSRVII